MGSIKVCAWFSKQDWSKQKQKDGHYFKWLPWRWWGRLQCWGVPCSWLWSYDHLCQGFNCSSLASSFTSFLFCCVLFLTSLLSWKFVWLRLLKSSDPQWRKIGHPRSRSVVGILYVSQHSVPCGHWLKSGNLYGATLEFDESFRSFCWRGKDEFTINPGSVAYNDAEKGTDQIHEKEKET